MISHPSLYLASASPRRQELLRQLGVAFTLVPAEVPEDPGVGEPASEYVQRLAREKVEAAAARIAAHGLPARPILGADTAVVVEDAILGKPRDREQAATMLRRLSGRVHEVYTGVNVRHGAAVHAAINRSRVRFAPLDDEDIRRYLDSGEYADKAGAYAIQGRAAAFIAHIEGSYSGIVGLPLFEVAQLLKRIGMAAP